MTGRPTAFAASLLVAATVVLQASPPPQSGTQVSTYVRDRWDVEVGFPGGAVASIAQTGDGYLWTGTDKGLVRFDGQTFQVVDQTPEEGRAQSAPMANVLGLVTDASGALWVRLREPRLFRYRGLRAERVTDRAVVSENGFTAMTRDQSGAVVLAGLATGVMRQKGASFETLATPDKLPRSIVITMAAGGRGEIWIGTRDVGLFILEDGRVRRAADGLPDLKINCIMPVSDRDVWVGTDNGVARWNGQAFDTAMAPAALAGSQILAMLRDRAGNTWIGTARGLAALDSHGEVIFDERDARSGVAVTALFEDREGNIWIGSARGIERARAATFRTYTAAEGHPSNSHGPVYVDREQRTWFAPPDGGLYAMQAGRVQPMAAAAIGKDVIYSIAGGRDGLWLGRQNGGLTHLRENNGAWTARTYTVADGLAQDSVYAVYESRDGAVWAATLNAGISRLKDEAFVTFTDADGLPVNSVASIVEGTDGTMWFATPKGLSSFKAGAWHTYDDRDGLPVSDVTSVTADADVIWIGTARGLAWLEKGRIQRPSGQLASLTEHIVGMAMDRQRSLWLATSGTPSGHVVRVSRDALFRGEIDKDAREYGLADGLRSVETMKRHRTVVTDPLGRVWLSMTRGLSVTDPAHVRDSGVPAIVHIESVSADGAPLDTSAPLSISAASQRVTFTFAGVSLSVPERVRFRYRLDNFDRDWSEPFPGRETVYTNLHPGSYTFRVMASSSEGLWNGTEAAVGFTVVPVFWQTWWFRTALVAAGTLGIVVLYRMRVHQVSRQLAVRFEERLAERTRIAQELHDTLLQGFVSASMQLHVVADRLPAESAAKAPLQRVINLMGQVIEEGRNAVRGLRSPISDTQNLEQAFSGIQKELAVRGQVDYRVIVEGQPRVLSPVIRDEVYRIGREALTNAFRHSGAKSIEIALEYAPAHMRLLVRDDGIGIDPGVAKSGSEGHWGLSGMRERAERIGARLKVFTRAAAGTEVELSIPAHIAFRQDQGGGPGWAGRLFRRLRGRGLEDGAERQT